MFIRSESSGLGKSAPNLFFIAASFLVLSGIASLTYQVAWVRLLGLSMGSTSASISTVLGAFFLGMALGSYFAEKITRNRISNFTPYIALELLIGLSGLALLPILLNLDMLMAQLPVLGSELSLKFLLAMLLLSIPTICMGATFPVMASILIRSQDNMGLRVGQLYSLNTAGAVLGAALSGFVFIPAWGLDGAIYIAFSLNMAIVLIAWHFNRGLVLPPLELPSNEQTGESTTAADEGAPLRTHALIVLFVTGFVAIATQVGWTKYLAIFTGTTIYGFAAILTVFLSGIAIGSWAIKNYLERIRSPQLWMAIGLILLGTALILTRVGFNAIPPVYTAVNHLIAPSPVVLGVKYFLVFILLFVPTFLFGALFPLNLKLYCGNLHGIRARIGKAYAINTVASILGAILAGFWFIPEYGTDAMLTGLAIVILFSSLLFLPTIIGALPQLALASAAGIAVVGSVLLPHLNYQDLIASVSYRYDVDAQSGKQAEFLFLKEGKAGVISMVTYDGVIAKLQSNGLNESLIHTQDPNQALLVETLLGLMPYMLQEQPKSAFVVGFGGGITTRALSLTNLESIRVVELEPAVVEAGRALAKGEIPVLNDPRVRLNFNDARNTLLVENKRYDIIAAQPSHPWLAGASSVFTQQFWQLAKSRLNEGGVLGQWVNLFNMDATTLRSIFQAFYGVFPHGITFANLNTGDLLLFGSNKPIKLDYERIQAVLDQPKVKAVLSHYGINTPQDLLWYFALSRQEALAAAGNIAANSDTNILSEVRLSTLTHELSGAEDPSMFLQNSFYFDLAPYIDNATQRIYSQANYFFSKHDMATAETAGKALTKLSPVLGRGVAYEHLWRTGDIDAALELYVQHQEWPDRTHAQQALVLLEVGRQPEALLTLARIKNEPERRAAEARILFETGDWQTLAALQPQSDEERRWQLLGVAKNNSQLAGRDLLPLVAANSDEIPQLRALVQYFAALDDRKNMDVYSRRLIKATDGQLDRLSKFANTAITKKQIQNAKLLIGKMAALSPGDVRLNELNRQIKKTIEAANKKDEKVAKTIPEKDV